MSKLTGIFILLSSLIYSQRAEIGISVLSLNTFNSYNKLEDTASYSDQKSFIEFRPVVTLHKITAKAVEYYIQGGYFFLPSTTDVKRFDQSSGSVTYRKGKSWKKSLFCKIGFGKRTSFAKLLFISGANISFEYFTYQMGYTDSYYYNSNSVLLTHSYFQDTKSPEYITGISLQQSMYYQLSSSFLLGIDLNLGIQTFLVRGERKIINSHKDFQYPQYNYHLEYSLFYKSNYTSLNFQPNVSLRYIFPKRETLTSGLLKNAH